VLSNDARRLENSDSLQEKGNWPTRKRSLGRSNFLRSCFLKNGRNVRNEVVTRVVLEQLKQTVPMETLLEALGFELGKNGRTRCILHGGDNPTSFSYTEDHFHCFACSASGDKLELIMQVRKCSFEEAVKHLRQLAGGSLITLSDTKPTHRSEVRPLIRRLESVLGAVDDATEAELRCEFEQNDEMLRKGEITPCEYYTRQHLIDEEFEALDARRIESKYISKRIRKLVRTK
jgi:hypothetical protein